MRHFRLPVLACLLILQACAITPRDPSQEILGAWQYDVGGFPLITTFSEAEVRVNNHEPLSYELLGDRLTVAGDTTSARLVSFPSRTEMVQTDTLTGTRHYYVRAEEAEAGDQ